MAGADNILIIKLGALGDFIQALGPMKAIRAHHKDSRITLLTTAPFEDIARKSGYVDDVIIDTRPKWHNLRGWRDLRGLLHGGKFTRVYDLQNNDRTGLYFKLFSKTAQPEWVGIAKGASIRNTSPERTAGLAFDGHVQTLGMAGVKDVTIDTMDWVSGSLAAFWLEGRAFVLMVPGAAPTRPEKRWPAEHYGELARRVADWGFTPVIIGGPNEKDIADAIREACDSALDLTGQTSILDIAFLGHHAAAAIGNDTGPMHVIGVTGCPSLVLFSGNSNPVRHKPLGADVRTLQRDDLKTLAVDEVVEAWGMRSFRKKSADA